MNYNKYTYTNSELLTHSETLQQHFNQQQLGKKGKYEFFTLKKFTASRKTERTLLGVKTESFLL